MNMADKTHLKRDPARCPSHPGAVLRELVLPEVKATKSAIGSARMWLGMQAAYDLWHAQQRVDVKAIPSMRAA
jgi:hypothetical protein